MSAVSMQATLPRYEEALAYWDELTLQCRRHVNAINDVVRDHQMPEEYGITWRPGRLCIAMNRGSYPSTEVKLSLTFEHWGPKIGCSVRGFQDEDLRFYPEDFDFSVGTDEDEQAVAITAEGRSLTPHELAKYVSQHFRRCYPGVSLPCPESPL